MKQLDKDLLHDVEGILFMPYNPIGNLVDLLLIMVEDLPKRLLISLLASRDQFHLIEIHLPLTMLDEN